MDVFALRNRLIEDYSSYARSFIRIRDDRIRTKVEDTVKRYRSDKAPSEDGSWRHTAIFLEAENPAFSPIVLRDVSDGEVRVIAEFVEVLSG